MRLALSLALLASAVGALIWWIDGGRHQFLPRKWGVVEDASFYRSGQIDARIVEDVLREHDIDLIVDLASGDPPGDPDEAAEQHAAERLGIRRLTWRLPGRMLKSDEPSYVAALREVIRARAEGKRVLVHCNAGRERTGVLVAAYRMLVDGWSGNAAYDEYLSYRKDPPEGYGDVEQFLDAELPEIAKDLAASGDIASPKGPLPDFGPVRAAGAP